VWWLADQAVAGGGRSGGGIAMKKCSVCRQEFERCATGRRRRFCSSACRQAAYRRRLDAVQTAHGSNADLISAASRLYIHNGAMVADVTYGRGAFWTKTDTSRFTLLKSDLLAQDEKERHDFRALPYADQSVDVVVLDPPYVHNPGRHMTDGRYNNAATTGGMYHEDIVNLYRAGMVEAKRVLRQQGQLWVKCKDEVESSRQCWSHMEIHDIALELGYSAKDLFVLVPTSRTSFKRWSEQLHARKSHSFLWVFRNVLCVTKLTQKRQSA
jgi:hypothetical protein